MSVAPFGCPYGSKAPVLRCFTLYLVIAMLAILIPNVFRGYSDTNGIIFTLVDTASAELQQKAESTLEPSSVEEKNTTSTITLIDKVDTKTELIDIIAEEVVIENQIERSDNNIEVTLNDTDQKLNISDEKVHDIPSFSEWTQKQLEEAEKKKEKGNISANNHNIPKNINNLKLRSKNYASPDCGAKIIAANPEAVSAGSVLSPSRDEYKLNTCTSRIWFIVELCEAIQAKKIDLANFELFSSSPKDFSVSVSDRFPSRDWSSVGQFTAKDERDIQSFNLHPHLFGKYIKVEMLSHYGSEHFCPISLFRVYGTSEFEVLETEDSAQNLNDDEDDDDETLDAYNGEPANNLFGSARDAVMSIVKKAAEVLVKGSDSNQTVKQGLNATKYIPLINSCTTPSRIIVCDNCSEIMFGYVYETISCKSEHLKNLIEINIVSELLYNTNICVKYGLNFTTKSSDTSTDEKCGYYSLWFSPIYTAALCNILAVIENKVVLNISNNYLNTSTINNSIDEIVDIQNKPILETLCLMDTTTETKTCAEPPTETPDPPKKPLETKIPDILEIKPTKTISEDAPSDLTDVSVEQTQENLEPSETPPINTLQTTIQKNLTEEMKTIDASHTILVDESTENFEIGNDQFDNLLSELNLEQENSNVPTTIPPPSNVPQQAQKESVFLRLSSRIKALERNMSLSGQYLEELSRRYKKQVEEMQKVFEKKLSVVTDEIKRRDERESKMEEQLSRLTESLNSLLSERDGFWKTASLIGQFLFMEIFVACILIYFCWRSPDDKKYETEVKTIVKRRRQSIDIVGHETPVIKKSRRPSEEALKISGTYEDLLIQENDNWPLTKAEKRRRRKKNALLRTQSIIEHKEVKMELIKRSSSFDVNNILRKQSAPAQICVNGDVSPPVKLQEHPFALEESEHTPVEPLQVYTEKEVPKDRLGFKNGGVRSAILKSSPIFMKTALSARSKRSGKLSLFKTDKYNGRIDDAKRLDNNLRRSPDLSIASNNISESTDDRSSVGSVSIKKEKKGGFRKLFKKVFE